MCPEFASGRMERDRPTAPRRLHSDRTSSSRIIVRDDRDRNRNVIQQGKWERSSCRIADCKQRRNTRHKNSVSDTERRPRTDECSRSSLQDKHKERPCEKVLSTSNTYMRRDARNDLVTRRHADNYISQGDMSRDRSLCKDRSSHSRLSANARTTRPTGEDHFVDTGTRHYTCEPHSRKYIDTSKILVSQSNDERESRQLTCSCTDATNSRERKTSGIRTSRQRSDDHITSDSSFTTRGYSDSNRRSRGELYEVIQHSHPVSLAGCLDYEADYQATSEFSGSRCKNSSDYRQGRTDVRNEDHARVSRHNVASSGHSKTELSSRVDDQKSRYSDRRRSSPGHRHSKTRNETVSSRKRPSHSDGRRSPGRDRTDRRNADKTDSALSFRKSASRERKRSRTYHETPPSCVHTDKSDSGFGERASDCHASLPCSSKEDWTSFESDVHQLSHTSEPGAIPAAADDDDGDNNKQWFADSAQAANSACGNTDTSSATPWLATEMSMHRGSLGQSVIESNRHQQWIDSNSNAAAPAVAAGLHWEWHGSTVTSRHDNTRLHSLGPATAIAQLPRLSTKMSTVPATIDPRKLVGMSAVSQNSNINFSTLPSNASFDPAAMQPAVGSQYMADVCGDSPLLDEPMYYSYSPPAHDRSSNVVGSSVSSLEYVHRPDPVAPMEDSELRKMLDVVNVAKTTLEKTLPPGYHGSDLYSLKQQKVCKNGS